MQPTSIESQGQLEAILSQEWALIFLRVNWSSPALMSLRVFRELCEKLPEQPAVACAMAGEESEVMMAWLQSLGHPVLTGTSPLGAGSLIFLERGKLVHLEVSIAGLQVQLLLTLAAQVLA